MHPDDGRVVSNFIVQALRGDPITIYGDGSQTRSFCYVSDLIEGLVALMEADDSVTGPVNLGNPYEMSILELAKKIIAITSSKSVLEEKSLPGDDPTQRCPDIGRAKNQLGWAPTIALEDGLKKTIRYFKNIL
jgi:UDP-glucuronate decarboxylase